MKIFKIILLNIIILGTIIVCLEYKYAKLWGADKSNYKDFIINAIPVDEYYENYSITNELKTLLLQLLDLTLNTKQIKNR